MRFALLLIVVAVLVYVIWQVAPTAERRSAMRLVTKHGLRLGAIVLGILLLLMLSVYLPSTNLLFIR